MQAERVGPHYLALYKPYKLSPAFSAPAFRMLRFKDLEILHAAQRPRHHRVPLNNAVALRIALDVPRCGCNCMQARGGGQEWT